MALAFLSGSRVASHFMVPVRPSTVMVYMASTMAEVKSASAGVLPQASMAAFTAYTAS